MALLTECDHGHVGGPCSLTMNLTSSPVHLQHGDQGLAQTGAKQACVGVGGAL